MGDSVQVAPLVTEERDPEKRLPEARGATPTPPWWQGGVLFALLLWLYGPILWRLASQWFSDKNFSHGIFVPIFALFVVWQERTALSKVVRAPSWTGIPILICGLAVLVLGVLGAELFFSRSSLLLVIAGLIILFWGWPIFRTVLFPWACLILMIPIPAIIFQKVTFPMQIFATKIAASLLPLAGVPVYREGNIINLPAMPLEVVQACSGIRSLLSLVTLAIIYGYLLDRRKSIRILLAISAVPIAILANSLRIVGTGLLVQYWDPDKAEGFYHTFQGLLIFVVSLVMLFIVHRVASQFWPKGHPAPSQSSIANLSPSFSASPRPRATLRFSIAALLIALTASMLQARSHNEVFPPREALNSFPATLGSWTGTDISIDPETLEVLGPGEFLFRAYKNPEIPPAELFIAYFRSERAGEAPHSPSNCLPGAGWTPTQRAVIQMPRADGTTFPANRYVVSKRGERGLVIYWFQSHDREVASEYLSKFYLVTDSIRMNRSDGAMIRLTTDMAKGESADVAQARLMQFAAQIIPLLDRYIPK